MTFSKSTTPPDPGRTTLRRLNRREYANTVRDLLGIDFDPTEKFPDDEVGYGFDNISDVLTMSPLLIERYLDAAETVSRRVIKVTPPAPSVRYALGRYLSPRGNMEDVPFRLLDPTAEEPDIAGPLTTSGSYLKLSQKADFCFRATLYAESVGDEPVKVALFVSGADLKDASSEAELARLMGSDRSVLKTARVLKIFEITARTAGEKQTIKFFIHGDSAIQRAGIAVVRPPTGRTTAVLHVEHLSSEGPLHTLPASHLALLASSPQKTEAEQHIEVISRLVRRAFRRPPEQAELDRLVEFAEAAMADGDNWETAMQKVVQIILCSPKFLFRVELDDRPADPNPRPVNSFHLASRLSYFLWSSMPDDELMSLAEARQLRANLEDQITRMLADGRSSEFVRSFSRQWLQTGRLERLNPDAKLFPAFSERLRAAMLTETELLFRTVMQEGRSILDLLDTDFTFLNALLAEHYGIADTAGNVVGGEPEHPQGEPIPAEAFVRVVVRNGQRGRLLTQPSILTVTSNPTRTSPVKRGKWVLEQILGTPPPPNVPELADENGPLTGTLREQMEKHQANPNCASCHATMDALGFAFENYNAVGAWRKKDGNHPVSASGELPDGRRFSGLSGLRQILRERKDDFAKCLTEKMFIYALGRGIEY